VGTLGVRIAGGSSIDGSEVWGLLEECTVWIAVKCHVKFRWGRWDIQGCSDKGRNKSGWQLTGAECYDC